MLNPHRGDRVMSDDRLFQDQKKTHRPCSADQCRSPALMCLARLYLTKWNQNVMRREHSQKKQPLKFSMESSIIPFGSCIASSSCSYSV